MAKDPGPDPGEGERILAYLRNAPERYSTYIPYTIRILLEQGKDNSFSMEETKIVDKLNSLIFHDKLAPSQYRKNLLSLTKAKKYTWFTDLVFFEDDSDPPIWKLNTDEFDESQTEEILNECNKEIAKFHVKILIEKNLTPEVYFIFAGKNESSNITWVSIAAQVLIENSGKPLHYKNEIGPKAVAKNLKSTNAQTPEETILRDIRHHMERFGEDSFFTNPETATYGLKESMTFKQAIELVLFAYHKPMKSSEISKIIEENSLTHYEGETPERTISTELIRDIENGDSSTFVKFDENKYALRRQTFQNISDGNSNWYEEFLENIQDSQSSLDWETAGIDYREHANFDLTTKSDEELRELPKGIELTTIKNIKKGSIVVINKNNSDGIVNTGIVTKEYHFEKDSTSYIHRVGIKYLNIPIPEINYEYKQGIYHTLQYQDKILRHLLGDKKDLIDKKQGTDTLSVNHDRTIEILRRKKNIILSGPPGTGKTYTAKQIAKSLVASNSTSSTHQFDLNKNYFMINGGWSNLGFSLSQEPFIWATQGTDPSTKAVWERLQPGDVVFVSNSKKDHGPFHSEKVILAIGICVKKFMGTQPYWQDEKEKNKVIYDYRFELKLFRPIPSKAIQFNSIGGLPFTKGFNAIANEENIKQLLNEISINWSDGSSYIENITFHQSFSYEEFLEGIKPKVVQDDKTKQRFIDYSVEPGVFKKLCMRAEIDSDNTYAMIIDEINRGNISKIFGELITIIENDKRGDEVTLSYSGKKFSVPENVYVIGTMNTADQSLTQIDAALKRRFSTVEVMPNSSILEKLIEQTGIGLVGLPKLLDKINAKIRVHRTRHNQIGHSYFMHDDNVIDSIKELQFVFATDVIPLLQDYFYADEDALKDVLDNQFIDWGDDETGDLLTDWQDDDGKFKAAIKSAFDIDL